MNLIYNKIVTSKHKGEKLLAVLLDPDKLKLAEVRKTVKKIDSRRVDFIFVGGSIVKNGDTEVLVKEIKLHSKIPVVLFPGDYNQITNTADGILFLTLLSGRNPEYLIEQQIKSVSSLQKSKLEVISTGYILIDGGVKTAVQKVSNTLPISQTDIEKITNTACAGMYMGNKLIYLEAGSGAKDSVAVNIIRSVKDKINIPLIVGGGIKTKRQLESAYQNGADLVVIGNGFEENNNLLFQL